MSSISVVIPTRGRHHFLRQALESVMAQGHAPHEIIVVDDGVGAAEAVAGMHPAIRVLDNGQRGPVPARNLGIAHATGDCICFLDDDDWFIDNGYFARVAEAFARGAGFCFCDGILRFEDGRPDLPFAFDADMETLTRDNTILISGVVYRRSLHLALGTFDESLPYYWDWDWYLRVARAGHPLTHIRMAAVAIRVHAQNMSGESLEAQRRANLDRFSTKHALPPVPLKNHLDIATQAPGKPPQPDPSQINT
ncbi:MAG: glycosyltransferase family 2 protein [Aestuariivirga sp.]|uniref:glycosyltransferase family 2 protein n=1 Tax=Aestuariivirga sp. TaxID=2650926 RepID=UPI0025BD5126|nr:glycosyltransferase family A protein [Aestuariivirga sp.]MCA3562308.1 glycosyltransferase family 2 protein [Aestuariivirga sp.]